MSKTNQSSKILSLFLIAILLSSVNSDYIDLKLQNKCFNLDTLSGDTILSFYYQESYYRAIHASYRITKSRSVLLKYLGDESRSIYLSCIIDPSYSEYVSYGNNPLRAYTIPCRLDGGIEEGNYCINMTSSLIGDIVPRSYCSDSSKVLKFIRYTNIPKIEISSFKSSQISCINGYGDITLVGTIKNRNIYNNINNIKINVIQLSNTEKDESIYLSQCTLSGGTSVGSTVEISCQIPSGTYGTYSVLYDSSKDIQDDCPNITLSDFNSNNFNSKKLIKIIYVDYTQPKVEIFNVIQNENTFDSGSFTLVCSLLDYDESTYGTPNINSFSNKDIGIIMEDDSNNQIQTLCSLSIETTNFAVFNIICTPQSFNLNQTHKIYSLNTYNIGTSSNSYCSVNDENLYIDITLNLIPYYKIVIYDDNFTLTCSNQDQYLAKVELSSGITQYVCADCTDYCTKCQKANQCDECYRGYNLIFTQTGQSCQLKLNYFNLNYIKNIFFVMNKMCIGLSSFHFYDFYYTVGYDESFNFKNEFISNLVQITGINNDNHVINFDCKLMLSINSNDICDREEGCLTTGKIICTNNSRLYADTYYVGIKRVFSTQSSIVTNEVDVDYCQSNFQEGSGEPLEYENSKYLTDLVMILLFFIIF